MHTFRTIFSFVVMMLITLFVQAQNDTGRTGLGETMRSNGRIYVVIAVILTILIGLILYVVRLDRKIRKFENEQ